MTRNTHPRPDAPPHTPPATVAARRLRPAVRVLAVALLLVLPAVAALEAEAQDASPQEDAAATEAGGEAATDAAAPPAAPPTCEAAEHRQFDFWVGEWDVYRWRDDWDLAKWRQENPDAEPAVNVITRRHAGCAVHEDYANPRGYEGSSLNFYDRADGRWHQTWIDSTGTALFLSGGLQGDAMVLTDAPAKAAPPPAGRSWSRITWTPQADGSVRQTWEQSKDGEEWQAVFDGRYVRRGGSE